MTQIIIVQGSPRVEVVFYDDEFEIRSQKNQLVKMTKYQEINRIEFKKGNIPWAIGILTTLIDLITGHGNLGSWKRGKGHIELLVNSREYIVELKNYDREQTSLAVNLLKEKNKTYTQHGL